MFSKLCSLVAFCAITTAGCIFAVDYEIQDIGTLQTHSSEAIAINNQGQILGWYNIDGSKEGKHFFVRDRNGNFCEVPNTDKKVSEINWRYLTDDGKAYGTYDGNTNFAVLFMWNQSHGIVNLGNLPGKEISAINNAGQVLVKSITENENGKLVRYPVIWQNGTITKLHGLEGNIGIESDESYGLDMNNNGDVVGQSVVFINYKNTIYKQVHAVKWINGQAIDLHREIPKCDTTCATAINDLGDIIVGYYLIRADGQKLECSYYDNAKATKATYFIVVNSGGCFINRNREITNLCENQTFNNYDCIWMMPNGIIDINDNGEIIARGKTVYGENHAMLLSPIKSQ